MDEWMKRAAREWIIPGELRCGSANEFIEKLATVIERHYRAALPTSLTELAKKMGDAGYCNYEACHEYLTEAYQMGYRDALETEKCPTCHQYDENNAVEAVKCYDSWHSSPAPAPQKEQTEDCLLNLLAVIHRDGGHYTAEHGVQKSAEDAEKIVFGLLAEPAPAVTSEPTRDKS